MTKLTLTQRMDRLENKVSAIPDDTDSQVEQAYEARLRALENRLAVLQDSRQEFSTKLNEHVAKLSMQIRALETRMSDRVAKYSGLAVLWCIFVIVGGEFLKRTL